MEVFDWFDVVPSDEGLPDWSFPPPEPPARLVRQPALLRPDDRGAMGQLGAQVGYLGLNSVANWHILLPKPTSGIVNLATY